MRFVATSIEGAFLVEPEPIEDDRGFFARTYCREQFMAHGLDNDFLQHSVAFNLRKGTLRGMHFQRNPYGETKLVRCIRGEIYDVILDIRPASPTFLSWYAVILNEKALRAIYIPEGCAHGYMTLEDNSLVEYLIDKPHSSQAAGGIRFDDPLFGICWPEEPAVISEKDRAYPLFDVRNNR